MTSFVSLVSLFLLLSTVDLSVQDKGSTPHIKEIVVGRCYDYQYKKFWFECNNLEDCSKIWEALYGAFAYKNPCNLTFADYKPYFDEVGMADIYNKSLFWSGTYKAVHSYSEFDIRFTTLEDTMAGTDMKLNNMWVFLIASMIYVLVSICNFLGGSLTNWPSVGMEILSRNTTDGIDYDSCPKWNKNCDYTTPFWGQASKIFAENARGIVRVMVNGSRGNHTPAYKRDSFFGKYELPSFHVEKITELVIIVIHTINGMEYERCGKSSIKLLQEDAKDRGISVSCHDDPDDVRHILCADHPLSPECIFLNEAGYRNRTIVRYKCRNPRELAVFGKASWLLIIAASVTAAVFTSGNFKY
ncbi:hypothetical protein OS493_025514 [Desmophyllum pertusum]|uniref:ADP-ribosyl cyclase/cyclic ADP-ribose hydrolase n=1 Tax=Desmophyllum pertusum TaxID=174260 RepID=A0A9X0CDU6_9CNID|nr:hypothetical protein OS493_025514 [Desmophyllum pertusum]